MTQPAASTPGTEALSWRPVALATAGVFLLNGSLIAAWISRLPATRDRLDADPGTLGLMLLMSGIGSLAAMPFVGRIAARVGSRRVVLWASIASGLSLISVSITPTVVTTALALFVLGGSYGSWDVAMNIQGSYVDRQAGRDFMPRYHACWSLGGIVGAGFGVLAVATGISLTVQFTIAALLAVGGSIAISRRLYVDDREPLVEHADAPTDRSSILSRRIVLIGLITLFGVFMEGAAADWVALYFTDDRLSSAGVAALSYAVFATAMATSRFSGTWVIDHLGRARAIRIAGLLAGAGVATTLAVPGIPGALLGVLMWGVGVALVFPAAMSAGGELPGRAADGIAAVSTIGYGGFLLGPPLIGLLARHVGIGTALWILPAMGLVIAVLAPAVAPPRTRPAADDPAAATGG